MKMEVTLKKYFGYSIFRPYQKEIIEKILDGRDCLAVMATGSGKSLCYQVPPLVSNKTAIIISPLISLMQDQVMALKQRGINAEHLSSGQTDSNAQRNAESGKYDILYMTPEKACRVSRGFWSNLLNTGICLLAVDEAHCISEWGHDFRVEYKQLHKLRDILLGVPFIGLTATATEKVRYDIINSLNLRNPHVAIGSFDRENLFYGVKSINRGSSFLDELVQDISKYVENAGSVIIYCTTIKDVEEVSKSIVKAGISSQIYHGQMTSKAREDSHRSFIRDEVQVMVATIAFGMGIDKPNIRYVVHYGCPKSLESYYQESGRCGRDGIPSVCWLNYTRGDFGKADFYCSEAQSENQRRAIMDSFMAAQRYCVLTTCRRKYLLEYFGQQHNLENCGNCDNCTNTKEETDVSQEAFLIMSCIKSCGGNWGINLPIDVLRGSRAKKICDSSFDKLPVHGLGRDFSANWWKTLAHQLISTGYLTETIKDVYRFVSVSSKGLQFLSSCRPDHQPPLLLPINSELNTDDGQKFGKDKGLKSLAREFEGLSEAEVKLFKVLLEERMRLARDAGIAPYALCGDQTLKKITLVRPSTIARLSNIDGVNQHLVAKYGKHILECIQRFSQELNLELNGNANPEGQNKQKTLTLSLSTRQRDSLIPAKLSAWKMWQEQGLSVHKIANMPGRSAPIKEGTVLGYVLDAAKEGCEIDWIRMFKEIGLTHNIYTSIQHAVAKVGAKDKLKPIKDELPEEVTYTHIRAFMAMSDLGMSPDIISPNNQETDMEKHEPEKRVHNIPDDLHSSNKRQKVDLAEKESKVIALEATESSVLNFIEKFANGVSLNNIIENFNGSTEDHVVDLVNCLESDFLIFRKNNLYMLM